MTTGATALMMASEGGRLEVVRLLVERGANVNAARKSDGCTAMMWASEKGHLEIAQLLVESPAAESFATGSTEWQ